MKTIVKMIQIKDVDTIRLYSEDSSAGSLFFVTDTNMVYVLNESNEVINVSTIKDNHKTTHQTQVKPTNCKNCGAPLISHKCEYCGTEY